MVTKRFGFLAGLFLPLAVLAQTPAPPAPALSTSLMKRAQIIQLNELIAQANAAAQAKDWPKAKELAEKLIAANAKLIATYPDGTKFPGIEPAYFLLLGNAHFNLGKFNDAIAAYEKCIGRAQALRDGGDTGELQRTMAGALTSEGNAFLKLKKNKEAVACFERAAEVDPNPATAWFNLCATLYNIGDLDGAVAAADKTIALDPTKADAYFIKGSALFGNATLDAHGKLAAPAESVAALQKYLELAPNGPHADDVKQMLDAVGAELKTTYQPKSPDAGK